MLVGTGTSGTLSANLCPDLPGPTLIAFALVIALGAPDAEAQRKKRAARAPAVSAECTDFYTATNADWLKKNGVPADAGSVSVLGAFRERTLEQQRALLDNAMRTPQGNVQKLLGDFWASGLDEAAVEADGSRPIAPLLDRINAIKKPKDVAPAIAAHASHIASRCSRREAPSCCAPKTAHSVSVRKKVTPMSRPRKWLLATTQTEPPLTSAAYFPT